jgi:hypothetical protein
MAVDDAGFRLSAGCYQIIMSVLYQRRLPVDVLAAAIKATEGGPTYAGTTREECRRCHRTMQRRRRLGLPLPALSF